MLNKDDNEKGLLRWLISVGCIKMFVENICDTTQNEFKNAINYLLKIKQIAIDYLLKIKVKKNKNPAGLDSVCAEMLKNMK